MKPSAPVIFASTAGLLVIAAIVAGVFVIGGPGKARIQQLDEERLQALRTLSNALEHNYAVDAALPSTLDQLAEKEDGLTEASLRDPATGQPYEYIVTGPKSFQLCASFTMASREDEAIRWRHPAGQHCFPGQIAVRAAGPLAPAAIPRPAPR